MYVLDKLPTTDEFAPRSGTFVGYPREAKGFRVSLPDPRKVVITRDVKFVQDVHDLSENKKLVDFLNEQEEDDKDVSNGDEYVIQTADKNGQTS